MLRRNGALRRPIAAGCRRRLLCAKNKGEEKGREPEDALT